MPTLVHRSICREREFFIDNLLVRIHFIIVMIMWAGLAPWEFEFPLPGSLISAFLVHQGTRVTVKQLRPRSVGLWVARVMSLNPWQWDRTVMSLNPWQWDRQNTLNLHLWHIYFDLLEDKATRVVKQHRFRKSGQEILTTSLYHTVDYEPFIKSQLTRTKSTLRPWVVQIWSRYPPESGPNKTFIVHRVNVDDNFVKQLIPGEMWRCWVQGLGFSV